MLRIARARPITPARRNLAQARTTPRRRGRPGPCLSIAPLSTRAGPRRRRIRKARRARTPFRPVRTPKATRIRPTRACLEDSRLSSTMPAGVIRMAVVPVTSDRCSRSRPADQRPLMCRRACSPTGHAEVRAAVSSVLLSRACCPLPDGAIWMVCP